MSEAKQRGRPALDPEKRTVVTSIRLTPARNAKLRQLGSAWLNKSIDRAKVNKPLDEDR